MNAKSLVSTTALATMDGVRTQKVPINVIVIQGTATLILIQMTLIVTTLTNAKDFLVMNLPTAKTL